MSKPPPEDPAPRSPRSIRPPSNQLAESDGWKSAAQAQRLLHELRVHQIQLEMQNEELRVSRAEVETGLQRYTDLYDFAPIGYLTLSPEGSIRELNLPAARLLGRERSRLVGSRLRTFVVQSARVAFDSWLAKVFLHQDKQTCELVLLRDVQPPLSVEIEAKLSLDGQSARVVVSDITARKSLEEELRQAQKMQVVGQLAGGVAHDFNNILAAMILNLGLLRAHNAPPADAEIALQQLDALAKRASSLTNQLLAFSRLQAMHPRRLELNAALTRLLALLEPLLGEEIECKFHAGAPELWVEADSAMLEQAVTNLCLNARDAMPNGGALSLEAGLVDFDEVSVRADPKSRPGRFVYLQVSDTGSGMSADVLEHLFEPFFTTKDVAKASGLGLASVYGTVQQHQGWLNVESRPGRGATFRIFLPESVPEETAPLPARAALDATKTGETILLVEHEPALLAVAARALTRFGYRVLCATDSRTALALWEQHARVIDLLLTDMRMPRGMNGLALAERLARIKPTLKVIVMSGYSSEMAANGAASLLEFSYLAKPFELETLAAEVRRCLDERQADAEHG
jgi:signal transduction histidine kinase/ActR/RegA family two-component response regulator